MCVLKALDSRFGSPGRLRFELTFCVLVRFGHFLTFCVLRHVLYVLSPFSKELQYVLGCVLVHVSNRSVLGLRFEATKDRIRSHGAKYFSLHLCLG